MFWNDGIRFTVEECVTSSYESPIYLPEVSSIHVQWLSSTLLAPVHWVSTALLAPL